MNRNPTSGATAKSAARRRPSFQVAADIARILEKHGVAPLAASALAIGDEIGKGRFKQVRQGTLRTGKGSVAEQRDVVILRYAKRDGEIKELEILATLAQQVEGRDYVPEVLGACGQRDATLIVQERAAFGSVKAAMMPTATPGMTPAHKVVISFQLANAMGFLEQAKVVHADLACRNLLVYQLDEDPALTRVKVTDFGLAVLLQGDAKHQILKQPQATRWCAPEAVAYSKLSHKSDLWALGATIWELYAGGTAPWVNRAKRAEVTERLRDLAETGGAAEGGADVSADFPPPDGMTPEVQAVMMSCLQADEELRPSFAGLGRALDDVLNPEELTEPVQDLNTARTVGGASDGDPCDQGGPDGVETPSTAASAPSGPDTVNWAEVPGSAGVLGMMCEDLKARDRQLRADMLRLQRLTMGIQSQVAKVNMRPAKEPEPTEDGKFRRLRAFLRSPQAVKFLGHDMVTAMQAEVDEADAAKRTCLDEFALAWHQRRAELLENEGESTRRPAHEDYVLFRRRIEHDPEEEPAQLPAQATPAPVSCPDVRSVREPRVQPPPAQAVRDELVRLAPAGAPLEYAQKGWQPHATWTLWVLERSDCLRRSEFHSREDAVEAFRAFGEPGPPRVLRNPAGETIAFRSWATALPVAPNPARPSGARPKTTGQIAATPPMPRSPLPTQPVPRPMAIPMPPASHMLDLMPLAAAAQSLRHAQCMPGLPAAAATPPVPPGPSPAAQPRAATPSTRCQRPPSVAVSPARTRRCTIPHPGRPLSLPPGWPSIMPLVA